MEESKEHSYSLSEILVIAKSFFKFVLKKWWMLALSVLLGAGIGAIYYYMQKPKYIAETTFILEEKSADGGGLANLASQFGFNIGSIGGGSIFSGDNILDILKSKKIVRKVLLSNVSDSGSNRQTMADFYLDFSGARKSWQKKKPLLAGISFTDDVAKPLSPIQDSILNSLYQTIIKKNLSVDRLNKKSSIIKVQVTTANDVFARILSMRLVDEASKLYTDIRTGSLQGNISQLQRRSDSLLFLLNRKSFTAAAEQPLDINPAIRTASVPSELASRDKMVLGTLYAEVTKNLEASRLLLSQQTPVIRLLDQPGYLLEDNKKSLFFILILSSIVGGFLFIAIALIHFVATSKLLKPVKNHNY